MADRPEGVPVDQVRKMRSQGISDDKIVEALQRDGYLSSQIFKAISHADMKPAKDEKQVTDNFPDIMQGVQGAPSPPEPSIPPPTSRAPPQAPRHRPVMPTFSDESTEELIESIIDEKWEDIEKNVQKIVDWKNDTEKKMNALQRDMETLKEQFDKLHNAIIGKIGDYDKNIMNVGAEIKAMEKAFSKIIPEFAQSVTELTDLIEELKKK
ncbi:hypothetical protein ACFL1B_03965 [Nanoarchaeota archaeon]